VLRLDRADADEPRPATVWRDFPVVTVEDGSMRRRGCSTAWHHAARRVLGGSLAACRPELVAAPPGSAAATASDRDGAELFGAEHRVHEVARLRDLTDPEFYGGHFYATAHAAPRPARGRISPPSPT